MPASPSIRKNSRRSYALPAAIGAIALLFVLLLALPASLAGRLLPASVSASDYSGSFWHGAAGRLSVAGKDCGAIEWQLHPAALLHLKLGLDVHWVKADFALAANGRLGLGGFEADAVSGGGPLQDLETLTGLSGWHATVAVAFDHVSAAFDRLLALHGEIALSDLRVATIGNDIDLGAYVIHFDPPPPDLEGALAGQIRDTAGPLEVQAELTLTPQQHLSTLTGTARERASAPPALRAALQDLSQLRPRDAQGRIPLDIEFSF